ncbi:hypothetical protein B0H16DRAFT_1883353 [Mycena metata]|uniref:Uncharacterized protein n=1 Tax=Mycena metata TaxID=1033252 RepID=A0AAD7JH34_9AGAR|nr:hypothetical protein B0H16DRAFT_1883353 [Mycena metata]
MCGYRRCSIPVFTSFRLEALVRSTGEPVKSGVCSSSSFSRGAMLSRRPNNHLAERGAGMTPGTILFSQLDFGGKIGATGWSSMLLSRTTRKGMTGPRGITPPPLARCILLGADAVALYYRAFLHVIDRIGAANKAITNIDFSEGDPIDIESYEGEAITFMDALERDPIATLRVIVRQAIDQFLDSDEFGELRKYKLGDLEWQALEAFKKILEVPHAFQQKLSAEKTPTLGNALPAFEAMIKKWEQMQVDYPELADIIQKGLDKLGTYQERVERVPAYVLAMLINPAIKLRWISTYRSDKIEWAKQLFKNALREFGENPP